MPATKKESNIIHALSAALSDTAILYLKTQNYHWNVTGPHFSALHTLFQEQYEDLALALDTIAERIRTLGAPAPGSYAAFSKYASIQEEEGTPTWKDMLEKLCHDQKKIIETLNTSLKKAQEIEDETTTDLMIQRLAVHEKNHWMLSAHLES